MLARGAARDVRPPRAVPRQKYAAQPGEVVAVQPRNEILARSARKCETRRRIWHIRPGARRMPRDAPRQAPSARTIGNPVVLRNNSFCHSCASRTHHMLRLLAKNLTSAKGAD